MRQFWTFVLKCPIAVGRLIHANDEEKKKICEERLLAAYRISNEKKDEGPVIRGLVR